MSFLYNLFGTSTTPMTTDEDKYLIQNSTETSDVESEVFDDNYEYPELEKRMTNTEKTINELQMTVNHLETMMSDSTHKLTQLEKVLQTFVNLYTDNMYSEANYLTLFDGLNLMTIEQLKNIIPKMDLARVNYLPNNKTRYYFALLHMLYRKAHLKDEHVDFVLNSNSLTTNVREYLNSNDNVENVRDELGVFSTLLKTSSTISSSVSV